MTRANVFSLVERHTDLSPNRKVTSHFNCHVSISDSDNILINSYNTNTEKQQTNVFSNFFVRLLKRFNTNPKKLLNLVEYFNSFFHSILDAQGRNPWAYFSPCAYFRNPWVYFSPFLKNKIPYSLLKTTFGA